MTVALSGGAAQVLPLPPDLVCFAASRWHAEEGPQRLLAALSAHYRIVFVEPPEGSVGPAWLRFKDGDRGVLVVVPHLPPELPAERTVPALQRLMTELWRVLSLRDPVAWYAEPTAAQWTMHLPLGPVVLDRTVPWLASPGSERQETDAARRHLARRAVLQLVGPGLPDLGASLSVPAGIDLHNLVPLQRIPPLSSTPCVGWIGMDEDRLDLALLAELVELRPQWRWLMAGSGVPLLALPQVHWVVRPPRDRLGEVLGACHAAVLPLRDEHPQPQLRAPMVAEWLAAGRPVVATPVPDVVHPWGRLGAVRVAVDPQRLIDALEASLAEGPILVQERLDALLAELDWARVAARVRGALGPWPSARKPAVHLSA